MAICEKRGQECPAEALIKDMLANELPEDNVVPGSEGPDEVCRSYLAGLASHLIGSGQCRGPVPGEAAGVEWVRCGNTMATQVESLAEVFDISITSVTIKKPNDESED